MGLGDRTGSRSMTGRVTALFGLACLALACAVPVHAQVPPGRASTGNAATATMRVEKIAPPPMVSRAVAPSSLTTGVAIEQASAGDPTRFFVKRIELQGAGRLPQERLRKLASEYENREVTLGQLHILARRVRVLARQRGYPVADAVVPSQTVEGGIVKIVVSEGRFGRVTVRGNKYYPEHFVRRLFFPATELGVVHAPELYKSLLILNEYPDLSVQAQFAPGREPGTTDVVLNVKDARPVHVGLDYNNFGSRLVGRNRAGVTLWSGNSFTPGDEFLLRAVDSWPGRSHIFWNAGYVLPISRYGTKVGFQFADAETHARGPLTPLDIRGDADIFSFLVTHPLKRTFQEVQNLSSSLSFKTVRNFFFGDVLQSQDDLRVLNLGIDGAKGDRLGRWIYSAVLGQGLGTMLGGRGNGDPLSSRVAAGDGFTKTNIDVLRSQDLKRNRFALFRFSGQTSSRPLVTAEQFGVGGPDSVRGFIQSEALGDSGFTLSGEYRQQVWKSKDGRDVVQGVAFLDHGYAELKRPQVGEDAHRSLTGLGVGTRAAFGLNSSLRIDLGAPIGPGRNVDGDDVVLYVQAATRF